MTSKSNNLFMRITALSMLDILYFLWQPYPKSILLRTVCESGSHQSGGYFIGLDKGKKRDRFLNVEHVLDHISETQIEPSQVQ